MFISQQIVKISNHMNPFYLASQGPQYYLRSHLYVKMCKSKTRDEKISKSISLRPISLFSCHLQDWIGWSTLMGLSTDLVRTVVIKLSQLMQMVKPSLIFLITVTHRHRGNLI